MDPGSKKQRRRSVRNLRRSTGLVPPSVDYGSAWIRDNQDTNITNLVRSLEDLNCQDTQDHNGDCDVVCSRVQQNHEFGCHGDEACDGFHHQQCSESENIISDGQMQQPCDQNNGSENADVLNTEESQATSLFRSVKEIDDIICEENSRELDRLSNFPINSKPDDQKRLKSVGFVEVPCETLCTGGSHQSNYHCVQQNNNAGLELECLQQSESFDDGASRSFIDDNSVSKPRSNSSEENIVGESSCESLDKIIDNRKADGERSSIQSYETLDNSMSPEFTDFDICPNSTESSPSNDLMNQAISSFFDGSSGSAFNMSFSPMDTRPETPTSSTKFSITNHPSNDSQLRRSISNVISSLQDPVISSDSATSEILESNNCSTCDASLNLNWSTALSPACENPPSLTNTNINSGGMDRTFTKVSTETTDHVGNTETAVPVQTLSTCPEYGCLSPHTLDEIEQMTMLDFDFKTSRCKSKRTSRQFTPKETSESVNSFMFHLDQPAIVSQEAYRELDHSFETSSALHAGSVIERNTLSNDTLSSNYVISEANDKNEAGEPSSSSSLQSPSRSTLSDCGNVPSLHEKTKTKKQRRKSNSLARLLEESERFIVPQYSSQKVNIQCVNKDKENEMDEDMDLQVQDLLQRDQSHSTQRSLRTRQSRRKSWDFRKESQPLPVMETSVVNVHVVTNCILESGESEERLSSSELEDLQTVYGKQKYVEKSPQPLETIKESSNENNAFTKRRMKRYISFDQKSVTDAKEKKRMKKALGVYRGRQCYFPITDQEFDRKMLDVQLNLDC